MPVWLDVQYPWSLTINGIDVWEYLLSNSLRATLFEAGQIGTLAFELEDTTNALDIREWQEVKLFASSPATGTIIWGGYAVVVTPDLAPGEGHCRWSVRCESWETILNRGLPVRRVWVDTLPGDILEDLFTDAGITGFDFTYVQPGTALDTFAASGEKMTDILDRLADEAGFVWGIDASKYVIFYEEGTGSRDDPAMEIEPVATANYSTTFPPLSLSIQRDASAITNYVTVRGGTMPSSPFTDTFTTDGVLERWQFTHRPIYDVLVVTLDGVVQAFGIDGFNPPGSFPFLVNLTLAYIRSTTGVLAGGQVLAVEYRYDVVISATATDPASITYFGHTFYDTIEDPTIHTEEAAQALADAVLAERAFGTLDITAEIDRIGVYPTQVWAPNFPVLGLDGLTTYNVRQVTVEIDRETRFVRCTVKAGGRAPRLGAVIEKNITKRVSRDAEYGIRSRHDFAGDSTITVTHAEQHVFQEDHTASCNGVTTVFTLANEYEAATTHVFVNGLLQRPGTHYTESGAGAITFTTAPATGDELIVAYVIGVTAAAGYGFWLDGFWADGVWQQGFWL